MGSVTGEYLGASPTEYRRIELRTKALDRPVRGGRTVSGARRGEILWRPATLQGPVQLVRIELKTKPMSGARPR